jgi:hypothetical protein
MLLSQPALADATDDLWAIAEPDDIECTITIDSYVIHYTYASTHPPKVMPIEGMMCAPRDYEAEAASFKADEKRIYEYWKKRLAPAGN